MNDKPEQSTAVAKREVRVVQDPVPLFDTGAFEQMQRVASVMADCSLMPESLYKDLAPRVVVANCFMIVNQARHWELDPFSLAQGASVVHGRLCWEGKVIHAVVEGKLGIRLRYDISGEGEAMQVIVSGTLEGETEPRTVKGTVRAWKTTGKNTPWVPDNYERQLRYRGAREWARAFSPGLILGVYSRDEMDQPDRIGEIIDITPQRDSPPDVPEVKTVRSSAVTSKGVTIEHDPKTGEIVEDSPVNRSAPKSDSISAPIEEAQVVDGPPDLPEGETVAANETNEVLDAFYAELANAITPEAVRAVVADYKPRIMGMVEPLRVEANKMYMDALAKFEEPKP